MGTDQGSRLLPACRCATNSRPRSSASKKSVRWLSMTIGEGDTSRPGVDRLKETLSSKKPDGPHHLAQVAHHLTLVDVLPFASATVISEGALISMCPAPVRYMSRARTIGMGPMCSVAYQTNPGVRTENHCSAFQGSTVARSLAASFRSV